MAYCRECGNKVEDTDKFCSKCGQVQSRHKSNVKPSKRIKVIALTMALIVFCSIIFFKLDIFKPSKASINSKLHEKTSSVNIGDYIEFGKYLDEPISWRVINKDENGIMLFSDKILSLKAFSTINEIKESNGSSYGMTDNNWEYSTIREWLNSDEKLVKYTKEPPSDFNLSYNAYDLEPGFLYNFSKEEISAIKEIKHKVLLTELEADFKDGGNSEGIFTKINFEDKYYDEAIYRYVTDKVFLLSIKEVQDYLYDRGWEYRAMPTEAAVRQSEIKKRKAFRPEEEVLSAFQYWIYWLRTPVYLYDGAVCTVYNHNKKGIIDGNQTASRGHIGIRPAIYIEENLDIIQGDGSEYNPYRLYGNTFSNDETRINQESYIIALDSPRDAVYQYIKAVINFDTELLFKVVSQENLEMLAKQRKVTLEELKDDMISTLAMDREGIEDLTMSDIEIQQPEDYQYMDKASVKTSFLMDNDYEYVEEILVELGPDGMWYVVFN